MVIPYPRSVFYISNRMAVAERDRRQELWAVDVATGSHTVVCRHPGIELLGACGEEVVFDDAVGVLAFSPAAGRKRTVVDEGLPLGFGGGRVFTADDFAASTTVVCGRRPGRPSRASGQARTEPEPSRSCGWRAVTRPSPCT